MTTFRLSTTPGRDAVLEARVEALGVLAHDDQVDVLEARLARPGSCGSAARRRRGRAPAAASRWRAEALADRGGDRPLERQPCRADRVEPRARAAGCRASRTPRRRPRPAPTRSRRPPPRAPDGGLGDLGADAVPGSSVTACFARLGLWLDMNGTISDLAPPSRSPQPRPARAPRPRVLRENGGGDRTPVSQARHDPHLRREGTGRPGDGPRGGPQRRRPEEDRARAMAIPRSSSASASAGARALPSPSSVISRRRRWRRSAISTSRGSGRRMPQTTKSASS